MSGLPTFDITALGREGDGIAHAGGAAVFVPFALPGETVRAAPDGGLPEVLRASPERVAPPCALFRACGGCVLQHLDRQAGLAWKAERVSAALRGAGFSPPAPALFQAEPRTRRRIDLAIRREGDRVTLGLHRRRGAPVDMSVCEVLEPELFALLEPLRGLLRRFPGLSREASVAINGLDSGPDLLLRGAGRLDAPLRRILAEFAATHAIARIGWADREGVETACQLRPVRHVLSGHAVQPAPGAFLQATRDGEAAIIASVMAGMPEKLRAKGRILDLFAGIGTLSFALAARGKVLAFEGDAAAASALAAAAGGTRVLAARRDLVRQPVLAREMAENDVVVLDPPFAGAAVQIREIAAARPAVVIYVSCNPDRLGEDAGALARAGYSLDAVSVIDQFLWSAHVESVSVFTRAGRQAAGRAAR